MTARTAQILVAVVIVLFAAVFLLNNRQDDRAQNELLMPGLKDYLDELDSVTVTNAGGEVTIVRKDDGWVVPGKDGYSAKTATLRKLVLAIADAKKIEQKTSNPELYGKLGVADPGTTDDESGVLVSGSTADASGDESSQTVFSLIVGNAAQQNYRYVRIADEAESWLIDKNPDIPESGSDWLRPEIVDIDSSTIRSVTITHDDGETIHIHKDESDAANFTVDDVPEGRELSYPSIANGIASALSNLTLEDVRAGAGAKSAAGASTVYTTFDGLQLEIQSSVEDDQTWISLAASAAEPSVDQAAESAAASDGGEAADSGDEANAADDDTASSDGGDPGSGAGDETVDDTAADEPAGEEPDAAARAAAINETVSGWSYRIADYKAEQITRRWEDLLKAEDEEEENGEGAD